MVGEKLFRAKIIGKSGENFTLFLIDIGKTEIMFADNIFELSDDLKKVRTEQFIYDKYFSNFIWPYLYKYYVCVILDSWFSCKSWTQNKKGFESN